MMTKTITTTVTEIVVKAGDAQSFTDMHEAERKDAQAAIAATLPAGEVKKMPNNEGQVFGKPGPAITRGQQAKLDAAERKRDLQLRSLSPQEDVVAITPIEKPAVKKKAPAKKAAVKKTPAKKVTAKKATTKKK